MKTVLFVTS